MRQVHKTARDLREGAFRDLGVDGDKPIVAVVTTYGELPFANSEWYFDFFVRRAAAGSDGPLPQPSDLKHRPAVLSIAALELFVLVLNNAGLTPLDLFDQKVAADYVDHWE